MATNPIVLRDVDGDPLDVPPEVVGWRVRRYTGRPGRPLTVSDPETLGPLELPREPSVEHVIDCCEAGRYRLDAFDDQKKLLPDVVAYVQVGDGGHDADEPTESAPIERLLQALEKHNEAMRAAFEKQNDTMCRAFEAMANSFGPVRPARSVVVEEPAPSPTTPTGASGNDAMNKLLKHVAETIFGKGTAESAAATTPPAGEA